MERVLIAYTLLRVALGVLFVYFGYLKLVTNRTHYLKFFTWISSRYATPLLYIVGGFELLLGVLLIFNIVTIPASLSVSVLMLTAIYCKLRKRELMKSDVEYYLLIFVTALSVALLA